MKPVVAILGRPNVGKSTLFNRLVGRRVAIVNPTPGVTRDRREGEARLGRLEFSVVDTAGLEEAPESQVEIGMQKQARLALQRADAALLLLDARAGVLPPDRFFADEVRRSGTPVVLVANKCESRRADFGLLDAHELGLGPPVAIAAEHGIGMADLEEAIENALGRASAGEERQETPLRLVIAGRPNVGKSTLMNRLLGDERVITGPESGTTRDAISARWNGNETVFEFVDTAGLRRKAKISEKVERLSVGDALEAVRLAHVVALVLDANRMPHRQDMIIARRAIDEGRAIVIAVNKWDVVDDRRAALRLLRNRMERSLPQIRVAPVVAFSALTGKGVDRLLPKAVAAHEVWSRRIATGPLNRWLADIVDRHPPPLYRGRRIRLRYMTQSGVRPPTFALFASQPRGIPESYVRYLTNELRDFFEFPGVPIRIEFGNRRNPYAPA